MMDGKVGDPGYSCEDGAVHRGIGRETNIRRLAGRAVLRQFTSACGNVRLESQYGTVRHSRTVTIWDGRAHSSPLAVRTGRSASENLDVFTKASGLFGLTVSSLRRVPTRGPVDAPSDPFFFVYATGIVSDHDLQPPLSRTSNGRPASYGDMDKHLALRAVCHGRRCPLTRGSPLCTLEWDPKRDLRCCHPPSGTHRYFPLQALLRSGICMTMVRIRILRDHSDTGSRTLLPRPRRHFHIPARRIALIWGVTRDVLLSCQ